MAYSQNILHASYPNKNLQNCKKKPHPGKPFNSSINQKNINNNDKSIKSTKEIAASNIKTENNQPVNSLFLNPDSPPFALKKSNLPLTVDYDDTDTPTLMPFLQNADDDQDFSFSLDCLKKSVDEIIENVNQEKGLLIFKCIRLASSIKNEIAESFKENSIEYFIGAFQICTNLPSDYKDRIWKFLVEDFKNNSFKDLSPFIHTLHLLTFKKEQSFTSIISFFNILAFIHQGDKTYKTNDFFVAHSIKLSLSDTLNFEPHRVSSIHLETANQSMTVKIPYQVEGAIDDEEMHSSFSNHFDLMIPLLPKLKIFSPTEKIANIEIVNESKIQKFAETLLAHTDPKVIMIGFRMLLSLHNKNALSASNLEDTILNILPKLLFNEFTESPKELFFEIQQFGISLLNDLNIDSVLDQDSPDFKIQKSIFNQLYLNKLLLDPTKQIIAFQIWKQEFATSSGKVEISVDAALKICELTMDHKRPLNYFEAFTYWKEFNKVGLFKSEENQTKEHQFIQKFLCNIYNFEHAEFEEYRQQLYPKLFERPLSANLSKKFHIPFFKFLKNLSLIGHDSKVLELIKGQPRLHLSKLELDEIKLLELKNQTDENFKNDSLLEIDSTSLSEESKKLVSDLSRKFCSLSLKNNQITAASQIVIKHLKDDDIFSCDFLKTILKEEVTQDITSAHQILNMILIHGKASVSDIVTLLESSTEKLLPFSKELKNTIKKIHVNLHDELMLGKQLAKAASLCKSLTNIFNLNELYPKKPEYWLDIIAQLDNNENVEFKETILKHLLNKKVLTTTKSFNLLRNSCHDFVKHYFDSNDSEKAISLILELQHFETPSHEFETVTILNITKALEVSIVAKDLPKISLFLTLLSEKNKLFIKDDIFIQHVNSYLDLLFKKNDFTKWMQIKIQFGILNSDETSKLQCKHALLSILERPSIKKNYETIFTILQTSLISDLDVWNNFFKIIKEKNLEQVKLKISNELKENPEFMALFTTKSDGLLSILEFSKDTDLLYTLFNDHSHLIFDSMENSNLIDPAGVDIISLIGKIFRSLKSNPLKRQALIKNLIPLHSKINNTDLKAKWRANKLFIDNCYQGDDVGLLIKGASILCSLLKISSFEPSYKDLIPSLLQILSKWPSVEIAIDGINSFNLTSELCEISFGLILVNPSSTCNFFEQYANLIRHPQENFQLLAILLYKTSIVNVELNPEISSKSSIFDNHQLIQASFESNFLSVQKTALDLFVQVPFQKQLKTEHILSYAEQIIKKIMIQPAESYTHSKDIKNISTLFAIYFKKVEIISAEKKSKYMEYFVSVNNKLAFMPNDTKYFLSNHEWMFAYNLYDFEKNKELNTKNLKTFTFSISMLNKLLEILQENPLFYVELHSLAYRELNALLNFSHINKKLLELPVKNFLYANDLIWKDNKEAHLQFINLLLHKLPKNILTLNYLTFLKCFTDDKEDTRAAELISMIKTIDEKTPLAIISRILATLKKFEKHLNKDKSELLFSLSHCFKIIQEKEIKFQNDEALQNLSDAIDLFIIENGNLLLIPDLDTEKSFNFCLNYIKTINHLISNMSDGSGKNVYITNMLIFDNALAKFKIVFNPEDTLSYVSEFLKITMPHEKESDDYLICITVLKRLMSAKTENSEMRKKKHLLILQIVNHYTELASIPGYIEDLKDIFIPILKTQFHLIFTLKDTHFIQASNLISVLEKKVNKQSY